MEMLTQPKNMGETSDVTKASLYLHFLPLSTPHFSLAFELRLVRSRPGWIVTETVFQEVVYSHILMFPPSAMLEMGKYLPTCPA